MKCFNNKIIFLVLFISMVECSCDNNKKVNGITKRNIGSTIIEANFINDSIIEGIAKYYDDSDNLLSIVNYHNGVKDGKAVNYYLNGLVKDSIFYTNGLINGFTFGYDSLGNLLYKENHYYGLHVGDRFSFSFGKIDEYFFSDFDKNNIVACKYDSLGRCRVLNFSSQPILTEVLGKERNPALGLFLYFPKPPNLLITHRIGLRNKNKESKNESLITDSRLFLDTVLNYPENGWNYYIATHIESQKDSINKTYVQELKSEYFPSP